MVLCGVPATVERSRANVELHSILAQGSEFLAGVQSVSVLYDVGSVKVRNDDCEASGEIASISVGARLMQLDPQRAREFTLATRSGLSPFTFPDAAGVLSRCGVAGPCASDECSEIQNST